MMDPILVPVAAGELVDKVTILEIKAQRITDEAKLCNVRSELQRLQQACRGRLPNTTEFEEEVQKLRRINEQLWDIEDKIRDHERRKDFGDRFIELARSVYFTNDRRSVVKRRINEISGSDVIEEKSYSQYE